MKNPLMICIILAAVLQTGCGNSDSPAPAAIEATARALERAPAGATVATVNGEAISAPTLEVFAKGRGLDPDDPVQRQRALDSLIENVLLAQDALTSGIVQRPEVQAELSLVRLQQLAGRHLSEFRQGVPVEEADLRRYYDREAERAGGIELHLKHILFDDQTAALAFAARANEPGADFDRLMAESLDVGAKQARALDWANLTQLPPELAEAAKSLADGSVGKAPVQTSFGWHVFKREGSRPFSPPPFEQVKGGARKQMIDSAVADKVKVLREKGTILIPGETRGR